MDFNSFVGILDGAGFNRELLDLGTLSWSVPVDTVVTVTVDDEDTVLSDLVRVCLVDSVDGVKVYFQYDRSNFLLKHRFVVKVFLLGVVDEVVFS